MNPTPVDKLDPHLNPDVLRYLDGFLLEKGGEAKVLELGAGGSTIWLAERCGWLVSYEHDEGWFDLVDRGLQARDLQNVAMHLHARPYAEHVATEPDDRFDLVLVDGRDRVDLFRAALPKVAPGGAILLDDSQRPKYRAAIDLAPKDWDRGQSEAHYPGVVRRTSWWVRPL